MAPVLEDQQTDQDEEEQEEQPQEPEFGQDADERRPSFRDAKEAYDKIRKIRGAKQEAQAAARGARAAGRTAQAAGRATAQAAQAAARAAAQLAARAAAAIASNPYVLAAVLIIVGLIIVIVIFVVIIHGLTSPAGGSAPQYPNQTSQSDMALTAKFRSLIGDPFNTDIAKQGAEFLKKRLTASQQTLAAKSDQDSQKLKEKIDLAITKLDEIIAEADKPSPDDQKIKKTIEEFFKLYDTFPGIGKNIAIAELAKFYTENKDEFVKKTTCVRTSCSGFVQTVMAQTNTDRNYTGNVRSQYNYVLAHPEKYLLISNPQKNQLSPGDILIRPVPGRNTSGHTAIYIGDGKIAAASLGTHLPRIQSFSNNLRDDKTYYWRYAAQFIQ